MADQPKKPRKIKDLKARLGRTIAPNQQGGGGRAVPPPAVGGPAPVRARAAGGAVLPAQRPAAGGGSIPAPAVPGGGSIPAPAVPGGGSIPAPAIPGGGSIPAPAVPGGGSIPAPSIPGGGAPGAAVVPPPFGRPAPQHKTPAADPFAAAQPAAAGPQEVRLVIDEKPVADSEVGRKQRGRFFIIAGVFLALGLLVGFGAGSMISDRNLYNLAVRDGKEIYQTVRESSDTVTKAKRYVDAAMRAARGANGSPTVDYQAIEALRALEKPLSADAFARRRYQAFNPSTVDALFEYYNDVNLLWDKFGTLATRTLPDARREALNAAAEATSAVATPTGCVPMIEEDRFLCGLVYLRIPEEQEGDEPKVFVRATRTSVREYEKTLYTGQDLSENPDNYVILTHPQRSVGVLGEQASEFAQYTALLTEIKGLMDRTMEVQGRLETELGNVARLEEVFSF